MHGRLAPTAYPPEWRALRDVVSARVVPGESVAVLPFTYYRRFSWNHDRVVLDPVPRWLDAPVVVNDDLPLSTGTVRGEDAARGPRSGPRLTRGATDRTRAGCRACGATSSTNADQPDPNGDRSRLAGLPVVWQRGSLALHAVPGARPASAGPTRRQSGVALGLLTLLTAFGAVVLSGRSAAANIRRLQRRADTKEGSGHGG